MNNYTLINTENINEARQEIENATKSGRKIIVVAKSSEFNRKIFENKREKIIIGLESGHKRDKLKQRDSGLNQVLCKLAKENSIEIGINIKEIFEKNRIDLALHLARLMQNINLCKKYKARMIIFNSGSINENTLISLLITLGMPTDMAKYAIDNKF